MTKSVTIFHIILLIVFSALTYLPIIGNGFIHDDFVHLYHVGYQSFRDGLLKPFFGTFFTPLTNLSFQIDWVLWGASRPFPPAAENLILHLANILLLYALVFRLWRSRYAALWAAFGFSLLFPANTWALLWIATRGHVLVTFFYLLTLLSVLQLADSERNRLLWIVTTLACAICVALSKESGITIFLAIPIMLVYLKKSRLKKKFAIGDYITVGLLLAILAGYLLVRSTAGAISINFDSGDWYSYSSNWKGLSENLLRYAWRTFGLLAFFAAAHFLKGRIEGAKPKLSLVTGSEILVFLFLFVLSLAPFVMLRVRSGIYSYLPGIFAALLLGAVLHSFAKSAPGIQEGRFRAAWIPIISIIVVYTIFTYGTGKRWVIMAKTNTAVLSQIHAQQPQCGANTVIILNYSEIDRKNRFPEGLAWGFPYALRLMYSDPTLDGSLIKNGEPLPYALLDQRICFAYDSSSGAPTIEKKSCQP